MKRFISLGALTAIVAVLIGGAVRAADLTVAHYGSLLQGAPYAIAMEKGFFKEAKLPIDGISAGKGGGDTVRAVLASEIKFGEAGVGAVLAARSKGVDVVIVSAAVSGETDMYWLVKNDSPIKSINDLKGKRVGYTNPNSGSDMLGRMVWKRAGIAPDSFTLIATGGLREGITMLGQGAIDAMPVIEPIATRLSSQFRPAFAFGDYVPSMTQTVGFAQRGWLEKNGDLVRGIIAARRKAVEAIYADPKAAAAIIAKTHALEPAIAETVTAKFAKVRYWSLGDFDRAGLDANIEGLELINAAEGRGVDWNQLIDQGYLPADLKKQL